MFYFIACLLVIGFLAFKGEWIILSVFGGAFVITIIIGVILGLCSKSEGGSERHDDYPYDGAFGPDWEP